MKTNFKTFIIAIVAVVALVAFNGAFVITEQNEYSVIRQFGSVVKINDTAGISLKIPFVQTVEYLPNTTLIYDLPLSDVITEDKKSMVADSFALWRVADPQLFIQTLNGSVSNAESRLSNIVYNAMKNVISSRTQTEVISGRDGALAEDIRLAVGNSLEEYGIELLAVETKHLDLPDDNKEAVYQRMISERSNIAAGYTAEGANQAQVIRNETDKDVEIALSEAKAQAEILIAEGEAEYMRILSDAYSDPDKADFYNYVRALDAAKNSLASGNNTLFLSPDSPLVEVFYNVQ